jgi:hypothetical protein
MHIVRRCLIFIPITIISNILFPSQSSDIVYYGFARISEVAGDYVIVILTTAERFRNIKQMMT